MATFLQLCQEIVAELGIAGGAANTPGSVTGQSGELRNVVRWIRDSTLWFDNEWRDWKYLWTPYVDVCSLGDPLAPEPDTPAGVKVRQWDRSSIWLSRGTTNQKRLDYMEWGQFREIYDGNGIPKQPSIFSVRPDGRIIFDCPPDQQYPINGEFWRRPVPLTQSNDVPAMPEEYHRLIVCRAAIMYANREDAPEVISGMETELVQGIEKLKSDQLAAFEADCIAGQDVMLEGPIPGRESN